MDLSRLVGYRSWSSGLLILKISLPQSQSIYCRLGRDVVKSGKCEPTYWLHSLTYRETDVATRTQNMTQEILRTSHATDGNSWCWVETAVCLKEKQLIGVGLARSSEVTGLNHSSTQTWHLRMQRSDEDCVRLCRLIIISVQHPILGLVTRGGEERHVARFWRE
jgi:hypothetical protein